MKHLKYICKNYTNIENYEKAKADNFKGWDVHHRLETHFPDGKRRDADISHRELIVLNMYYSRPPEELIFLTRADHNRLHKTGKHHSDETKTIMSAAHKGKPSWNKGKPCSEEAKRKMSESLKGKPAPNKGKHWKLVDGKRVYY